MRIPGQAGEFVPSPTVPNKFSGEVARFTVYPAAIYPGAGRRSSHYWVVLVFSNKGFMRRAYHQLNIAPDDDDRFGAIVMPRETYSLVSRKWVIQPLLGYVLLARSQLDGATICHEAVHMATSYLRRIKRRPRLGQRIDDAEEDLAYHVGRCAGSLNDALCKFCRPTSTKRWP